MFQKQTFYSSFSATPPVLRWLLKGLAAVAISAAFLSVILGHWLGGWTPQALLTLSATGIKHFFLWQWFSYLLVLPGVISFGSILYLLFTLYMIWIAGRALIDRVGSKPFIRLFVVCGLAGGVAGWLALLVLPPFSALGGGMAVAYGLLTAWAMHMPKQRVLLFFAANVQMRWLVTGLLALNLLSNLGAEQYVEAAAYVGSCAAAYFYGLLAWNLPGPFAFSRRFDEAIAQIGVRMRQWRHRRMMGRSGKVYDIRSAHLMQDSREEEVARERREHFRAWEATRESE